MGIRGRARDRVLTINAGSSSLKAGVFALEESETMLVSAEIERMGSGAETGTGNGGGGTLRVVAADSRSVPMQRVAAADHAAALDVIVDAIGHELAPGRDAGSGRAGSGRAGSSSAGSSGAGGGAGDSGEGNRREGDSWPIPFAAVAHRVVHGGSRYSAPQLVDRDLLDELRRLVPIDPNHLPQALSLIECVAQRDPHVPQIACFDTAFHRSLPRVAQMYALPPRFWDVGVRRYGFHGLSCEFILESLRA